MMETILSKKYKGKVTVKGLITVLLIVASFLLAFSQDALLFNPYIIMSVWFSFRLSPLYRFSFLFGLIGASSLVNINYGLEILLLSLMIFITNLINKFIKSELPYQEFLSLAISLILISIRYLSVELSFATLLNSLINVIICFILAISLEKVRISYECVGEELNNGFKIIAISVLYALFLSYDVLNLYMISLLSLILIKFESKEIVLSELLIVFLYNYLFYNISLELLLIYLFALALSSVNKKVSPLIFAFIVDGFYIVKYTSFYLDLGFYLNLSLIALYYLIPFALMNKIKLIFPLKENKISKLEEEITLVNSQVEKVKNYLNLLKINPIEEKNIELELVKNIERGLCNFCKNKESCLFTSSLISFATRNINKEERNQIINECFYPYKLIKRCNLAYKSYLYQVEVQENKIVNRDTFNYQIDTILKPLSKVLKKDDSYLPNRFFLDYEIITSGFSNYNGDSHMILNEPNKTFIIVSDGMGHNKIANQISSYLVDLFITSYQLTKNERETIQNINSILKTKVSDELYATLDLASFNLSNGELNLFKAGSFSTFLVRDGELIHFNKIFPPLGIIDRVNIFEENIQIKEDDYFIFMSDGFGENVREIVEESIDIIDKISLNDYTKMLYNELNIHQIEDDKTLLVVKVGLN